MQVAEIQADIQLTDAAVKRMRQQVAGKAVAGIRLSLRESGCSGLEYVVDFCDAPETGDHVLPLDGFSLFVDAESYQRALSGLVIDYQQDLLSSAFVFRNPNKRGECGCGVSFTV
ncbi:MAG: iron-sulfur cluster assembly accessory protein [Mariprofundaceae bacterium]|nr:iron-sulfur cluster assembly accessory protein [Mariprofundaceae bacterium]